MAALLGIGFASGLPNVLANDTLAAWLSSAGIRPADIGLFSLITFPYVFKFLWAPLMDRYVPPLLGRRRGWLLVTQVLLVAALGAVALTGPAGDHAPLLALAVAATLLVFLSASQDIVADAYRTDVLGRSELGAGAAVFVAGYRVAMIAGGAGVMLLAPTIGWRNAYLAAAALMAGAVVVTLLAPEPRLPGAPPPTLGQAVILPLRQFVRTRGWSLLLLASFVVLFRLPDVLAARMTPPLLLQELNFSLEQVGAVRQLLGFFITILGAVIGGSLVARLGLVRALWIFGVLMALSNAGFLVLTFTGNNLPALIAVIAVENFCGGLVAAGFVAFLMSQCDRRYSAFQYALLTSLMALTGTLGGAVSGTLVEAVGYRWFFLLTILTGVPALLMLRWIGGGRREEGSNHG